MRLNSVCLIVIVCFQLIHAQEEQQIQTSQTEQKIEKKSWWKSTTSKIIFGLSAIGAAAVITIGGLGYKEHKRRRALNEAILNAYDAQTMEKLLKEGANPNTRDDDGWPLLNKAVRGYPIEMVKLLLEYGADVNGPGNQDNVGITPLASAVGYERLNVIPLLLDYGADITKGGLRHGYGSSILEYIIRDNHPQVLQTLINSKSEIANTKWQKHTLLWHARDWKVDPHIIKILEDAGAIEE